MGEVFEGRNLSGATFWGVDLTNASVCDVNLSGARLERVLLVDVDIDGLIDRLVINGIDVTSYVNEHDHWYPLRGILRPTDVAGLHAALDALDNAWAGAVEHARSLTEAQLLQSVRSEWSFVETQRHLVFCVDKWFTGPLVGATAFNAVGLANTGSLDFGCIGLDSDMRLTLDAVLSVRAEQAAQLRVYADGLSVEDLAREVEVLENGTVPLIECFYTVFEESFEHLRYALRDLAQLKP